MLSCVWHGKAGNDGIGNRKTKQVVTFVVLKPTQASGFSWFCFTACPGSENRRAFRTQLLTAAASPRLTGHARIITKLGGRMLSCQV